MPNTQLTTNAKKAMTAPETEEVLLTLLDVKYDGESILRVADNNQEITSNGQSYLVLAFP